MKHPSKSEENLRSILVLVAGILVVFGAGACHRAATNTPASTVDSGDAKVAADRIAEAETLWDAREDMTKARVAVAALRQAWTAQFGNYEAAWKLSRACFRPWRPG